ncbi:ABC transporter substrate-binding protein [Acidimangrovimonas sediminis]|uniref:ABC transporter substrate-binding protein n=1 Tax=Acidimangrovimonas sediminis TaxID=2056283 RepID=UPI000C7F9CEE|nr:ABC transporter substrate-binding protein [Acidimangrovimonas sediminis]
MTYAKLLCSAVALGLALSGTAHANKADDTAEVLFAKDLDNPDIYFSSAREAVIFGFQVFDGLVYLNPKTNKYEGDLATSWKWVDPTTLRFELRKGVKFQNGDAFSADDVVFTFNHMADEKTPIADPVVIRWLDKAVKIDAYTVELKLKHPFPSALAYLANYDAIYPAKYYQKVGSAGFAKAPIGTGPYKVKSITPGTGYTLERNEDYFGGPKGKAAIKTVKVDTIPDTNTQLAELMNGKADFLWQVPQDQAQKLKSLNRFDVVNAPTLRVGYITMDATGRSMADSPFKKLKVRQAVNYAINREGIVKALMSPSNHVIDSACNPTQFGCETDVTKYPYDPKKAKELLAEAGYKDGFSIDLYEYRDQPLAEAMVGMLAKVGIKANLRKMQYSALASKQMKGQVPMAFMTWGSGSIEDVSAITSHFFEGGPTDDAKDPQVEADLKKGDSSVDPAERKAAYSAALKRIAAQAYWVPLWTYSSNYVMSKELKFAPTPDEIPRFFDMSWN